MPLSRDGFSRLISWYKVAKGTLFFMKSGDKEYSDKLLFERSIFRESWSSLTRSLVAPAVVPQRVNERTVCGAVRSSPITARPPMD